MPEVAARDSQGEPPGSRYDWGRPRSAAEDAAQRIREAIVSGALKPGEMIASEAELMEILELSRPTVREALRILASDGLVSTRRGYGGGVTIRHPDIDVLVRQASMALQIQSTTLADVWSALSAIEVGAIEFMVDQGVTASQVRELEEALTIERGFVEDQAHFTYEATFFHGRLVDIAGNNSLKLAQTIFAEIRRRASATVPPTSPRWRVRVHKEHEGFVRLLGEGDGPGAIAQWRQHMTRASKAVAGREAAVLNLFEAGAPLTKK